MGRERTAWGQPLTRVLYLSGGPLIVLTQVLAAKFLLPLLGPS